MKNYNLGIHPKVKWFAEIYTWMANGQGLAGQLKYPFALAVSLKVFMPEADFMRLLIWGVIAFVIIVFTGWFDLRFIKLHQATAEIQTKRYNPYFDRLEKSLKSPDTKLLNGRRKKRTKSNNPKHINTL